MAYGTPDTLDDVEPYYTHIRGGRPPTPEQLHELRERYRLVGGRTPLSDTSEATRAGLERQLNGSVPARYQVVLGMKHWRPWIRDGVAQLHAAGVRRAVGLVLAPHYSTMSIGGYYRYVDQAQEALGSSIDFERIESWHLHPPYLEAVAARARRSLAAFPVGAEVTVLFTAHSLPQRILAEGDPYPVQLRETSEALAAMLALPRWTFSYQSAGRTPEPWLGPDILETVERLAAEGVANVLVVPIGFVSDHLEIFYDIDYEARQAAEARGLRLERTESLNASPDFVAGLTNLVRAKLS
jgi:protoporphyrin/coproporphyrin ferrochelatase